MPTSTIIAFLLLTSLLLTGESSRRPFSKIFAFGDSFTDTGNTRSATGPMAFGYVSSPPYGTTFFHHPTNRYSDGRLVVDFLAERLSLPFLPPYLNKTADFSAGVNFAVAGSTVLEHEFFVRNNITLDITPQSLETELGWFEGYLRKHGCRKAGSPACRKVMDDALFWVGEIGVNDYAYWAYGKGFSLPPDTVRSLALYNVTTFLKALLVRGARYVVVQGQPLAGCLPLTLAFSPPDDRDDVGCSATANNYSVTHNKLLRETLHRLQRQHPQATIAYADYSSAHHAVMRSPAAHGFAEPFKVCCGSGGGEFNFDVLNTCGSPEVSRACAHPGKYVNWDGVHLTEAMYKAVSNMFFERDEFCHPPFRILVDRDRTD